MKDDLEERVATALVAMGLPGKPKFGTPCNHCGLCCTMQLCHVAEIAFPGDTAPCKALVMRSNKAVCGLVEVEELFGVPSRTAAALGVGFGCSMADEDTTDAEQQRFNVESQRRYQIDHKTL